MPIQNDHEIKMLYDLSKELEQAANEAKNHADTEAIKQVQQKLQELQNKIQDARGKAINGSGSSSQPLIEAQLRIEESQHQMERALSNLSALEDQVEP